MFAETTSPGMPLSFSLNSMITVTEKEWSQLVNALREIVHLLGNCPCMPIEAQHGFERNKAAEEYRVELCKVILQAKETAKQALAADLMVGEGGSTAKIQPEPISQSEGV